MSYKYVVMSEKKLTEISIVEVFVDLTMISGRGYSSVSPL